MTQNSTPAASLPNVRAALGTVVHGAVLRRPFGRSKAVPTIACMSTRQLENMRATGLDTAEAITCTKPKCQKIAEAQATVVDPTH